MSEPVELSVSGYNEFGHFHREPTVEDGNLDAARHAFHVAVAEEEQRTYQGEYGTPDQVRQRERDHAADVVAAWLGVSE